MRSARASTRSRRAGEAGEATSRGARSSSYDLVWPYYFFDPASAPPPLTSNALAPSAPGETFASIKEHFEAGTLQKGLRRVRMPVLFAHGIDDPLPLRGAARDRQARSPAPRSAAIPRCGHFPWLEQPGFLDRMIRGLIAEL